jgi:sugar lactone lactonase YvrE
LSRHAALVAIGALFLGACTAVIGLPAVPGEGDGGLGPDGTVPLVLDGGRDGKEPVKDGARHDGTLTAEAWLDGARDGTSRAPDSAPLEASTVCSATTCSGGTCIDAGCLEVFAMGQSNPSAITTSGGAVYWTNYGTDGIGSVVRASVGGGALVTMEQGFSQPHGVAVGGGHVYWTDSSNHQVLRAPLDGGPDSARVFDQADAASQPYGLALADGVLYWADNSDLGGVHVVPLDGGPKTVLASPQDSRPAQVIVAGGSVYWTAEGSGSGVYVQSGDAAAATLIDPGVTGSFGLAADLANLYWTILASPSGPVFSRPLGGGTIVTLAVLESPFDLAVADGGVYVTVEGASGADAGAVVRMATTGGSLVTLAAGQAEPSGIAFDGKSLYWANMASGQIMRLTLH